MSNKAGDWKSDNIPVKEQPLYIRWFISTYCNYHCPYCLQSHSLTKLYKAARKRDLLLNSGVFFRYLMNRRRNTSHSFKNYPPKKWSQAFSKLWPHKTGLTISGGEPFLDYTNFQRLLSELSNMEHIDNIRIDSNGSFQLEKFANIRWEKIFLNISYHPSMISLSQFLDSIKRKVDNGLNVAMVNFVMDPDQLDDFYRIDDALREVGIFVNANVYYGGKAQNKQGIEMYKALIPSFDIELKTQSKKTFGKNAISLSLRMSLIQPE